MHAELLNGFLGFLIFRIGRFLRVVFNEKPVLAFVQIDLSRVNEQKIFFFFYAIGLRIFCSTLCAKFEKNRTESNEAAIRIMYLKKEKEIGDQMFRMGDKVFKYFEGFSTFY